MLTTCKPLIFPNFSKSYNCTQTTSPRTPYRSRQLFYKSHRSFILLRLLSESNPLRWASIRFSCPQSGHLFCQHNPRRNKVRFAPPLQLRPAYAGFAVGFLFSTLPTSEQSSLCSSFQDRSHVVGALSWPPYAGGHSYTWGAAADRMGFSNVSHFA